MWNAMNCLAAKLPQAGQLWWPIPVLAAIGILLVLVGWRMSGKQMDDDGRKGKK